MSQAFRYLRRSLSFWAFVGVGAIGVAVEVIGGFMLASSDSLQREGVLTEAVVITQDQVRKQGHTMGRKCRKSSRRARIS